MKQTVFPHLQLLDSDKYSIVYSTDPQCLCQLTATHGFRNRMIAHSWWEDHGKRIVRVTISRQRSDKMPRIKKKSTVYKMVQVVVLKPGPLTLDDE